MSSLPRRLASGARLVLGHLRGDEEASFTLAEKASALFYPKYRFSDISRVWLEDQEFFEWYDRVTALQDSHRPNYHSADRKYLLRSLLQLVPHVPGDLAECGVYQGASARLMAAAAGPSGRTVHLFDSFEGLSDPGGLDGAYWSARDLAPPEPAVEALSRVPHTELHPGWIPTRFGDVEEREFCFVHVDVDLYEPTRESIEFFYPRMSDGGVMLFDDYGFATCPGAKRAVDDFMAGLEPVVHVPTGQGLVLRRKGRGLSGENPTPKRSRP